MCRPCVLSKHHCDRVPKSSSRQVKDKLNLVYMNVCGPLPEMSFEGHFHVATFLDEHNQLFVVSPIVYNL